MFFVFCIFIIPIIVLVLLLLSTRQKDDTETPPTDINKDCAICDQEFPIEKLIEQEVGDYGRLYALCGDCIENLYQDYKKKISIQSGE